MPTVVIFTTVPDPRTARKIAEALIAGRLAACVNVSDKLRSFYRWKGRLERSGESLLIIKTVKKKLGQIKKLFKTSHPYELPELIVLPVLRGSKEYLTWVENSVQ